MNARAPMNGSEREAGDNRPLPSLGPSLPRLNDSRCLHWHCPHRAQSIRIDERTRNEPGNLLGTPRSADRRTKLHVHNHHGYLRKQLNVRAASLSFGNKQRDGAPTLLPSRVSQSSIGSDNVWTRTAGRTMAADLACGTENPSINPVVPSSSRRR